MTTNNKLNSGLLLARLTLALVFIIHGWIKLHNLEGTGFAFAKLHIPLPQIMAYIVAVVQFGGGIALVIGILTRLTTSLLIITMAVAVFVANLPKGFVDGYEYPLVLLLFSLSLFLTGPGEWTIKKFLKKKLI